MTIDPTLIDPDERLLWTGRPDSMRYALGRSIWTFFFGILVFAFSSLWIYVAAAMTAGMPKESWGHYFWLFGIPFLLAGTAMLLSPAWMLYRAFHTTYLLTDKRAIVVTSGVMPRRLSVPLAGILTIDARPLAGHYGSIVFKETVVRNSEGGETVHEEGFIAVPELAHIEQILRKAIDRLRGAAA